jgi:hypothetical protein
MALFYTDPEVALPESAAVVGSTAKEVSAENSFMMNRTFDVISRWESHSLRDCSL